MLAAGRGGVRRLGRNESGVGGVGCRTGESPDGTAGRPVVRAASAHPVLSRLRPAYHLAERSEAAAKAPPPRRCLPPAKPTNIR